MPIEQALVARVPSHMRKTRASDAIQFEAVKGCDPRISNEPVALEPVFQPVNLPPDSLAPMSTTHWTPAQPVYPDDWLRFQAWQAPQQCCDWLRAELFLKHLAQTSYRVVFEVLGNSAGVMMNFLCHREDAILLQAAFAGQFEQCRLSALPTSSLREGAAESGSIAVLRDYYPLPPYSHLLTQPSALLRSPFVTLLTSLSKIPPPAIGVYQVVFQAVLPEHDWHANVQFLVDMEYTLKLMAGLPDPRRYPMQMPAADERHMAMQVEAKAHNDKPFFAAGLRVGVLKGNHNAPHLLKSLEVVVNLIQHGGRQLRSLTESDYRASLPLVPIGRILAQGETYRPGFLVNSAELATLVHLPPPEMTQHIRQTSACRLETLIPDPALCTGTPIGFCESAGRRHPVCIPLHTRRSHTHLVGLSGTGKSLLLLRMIMDDFQRGAGAVVFDPHGDLVNNVLDLVPIDEISRVVYFNPADPHWVPLWNPLRPILGQDTERVADDLVGAFKKFVEHWGDRLEHLLRNVFYSALCLYQCTLLDVSNLFRKQNNEALRRKILGAIDNEAARQFWLHDLDKYSKDDFGPPRNKLSKLLIAGPVSLMLSQPESAIKFHDIMDNGKLLLVDLSGVGSQVRGFLGSFMLSLVHLTALTRSALPFPARHEFNIYCDEAHVFLTESLEEIIAELRKFNVPMTLAHQFMSQMSTRKTSALTSVGSTIIFNVNREDAEQLKRNLQKLVGADDLTALEPFQAVARIGTNIVRFQTPGPPTPPRLGHRDEIIRYCHEQYYQRTEHVRAAIRRRGGLAGELGADAPSDTLYDGRPGHDTF